MNTNIDVTLKAFRRWAAKIPENMLFDHLTDPFLCPFTLYLRQTYPECQVAYLNIDKIVCMDEEEDVLDLSEKEKDIWYKDHSFFSLSAAWHVDFIQKMGNLDQNTLNKAQLRGILTKIREK